MKYSDNMLIWSDNFWLENNQAWLISTKYNVIFSLDMHTNECNYIASIPDISRNMFRLNPRCIKSGENIICMPDKGDRIWIYNIEKHSFSSINIDNPNRVRLSIWYFWEYDNKVYAVSKGLKQILEINIVEKKVDNAYLLKQEYEKNRSNNISSIQSSLVYYEGDCYVGRILNSINVGSVIYSLTVDNFIYQFDMKTKEILYETLPDIGRKFYTFCYDGVKFWLSGWYKELYIWDGKTMIILDKFPQNFGGYNFGKDTDQQVDMLSSEYDLPTFEYLVAIGEKVWLIPCVANKILYVDRNNYMMQVFEIEEENETKESLMDRDDTAKYVLEYVKNNRYIGLYSFKNRRILEIDTKMLSYRWCNYSLSESCLRMCATKLGNVFKGKSEFEKQLYKTRIWSKSCNVTEKSMSNIGMQIHSEIMPTLD